MDKQEIINQLTQDKKFFESCLAHAASDKHYNHMIPFYSSKLARVNKIINEVKRNGTPNNGFKRVFK